MKTLTTERLILRPWKKEDAEDLYFYAKNPNVGPIAGWPVHTSVENSLEIIENVLSTEETYAVCLKEDNRAIGSVGLIPPMQSHTDAADNEIEVGYWIGEPFWGMGLMPEAVKRLQRHAFEDLGCSAIWCGYYDGNMKSKRCQEKCGFVAHHTEKDKACELMGDVRTEHFTRITKEEWQKKTAVLFLHGKGGNALEANHYIDMFPEYDVIGMDYQCNTPWEAKSELSAEVNLLLRKYNRVILIAYSIGAYFAMNALSENEICKAYFVSPIVNMERLISDMMSWANVSEEELQEKMKIETDFDETLSWEYLTYVREHPFQWEVPTEILYGGKDNLTSEKTIREFAKKDNISLTVIEKAEHWFHTKEQMAELDQWIGDRI